jgi:hypothetical protein
MKIANIELVLPQEDYSLKTKFYGGGTCFIREAKNAWLGTDMDISVFGFKENFKNYTPTDMLSHSFVLDGWARDRIRMGEPITNVLSSFNQFDIVLHNHIGLHVNTLGSKIKEVFWSPFGKSEHAHPDVPYRLNYLPDEIYLHGKNYTVQIGIHIDEFQESKKEDYVFQCTRHDEQTNSIEVAKNCIKYGIKGYFGGPIFGDSRIPKYLLWDYIDNKNTFYLGTMTHEDKMEKYKHATMTTLLFQRNPPFNMSAIESLSCGTPILILDHDVPDMTYKDSMGDGGTSEQFFKKVSRGCNLEYSGINFKECFEKAKTMSQRKCYERSLKYSHVKMLESFEKALRQVYADKKT